MSEREASNGHKPFQQIDNTIKPAEDSIPLWKRPEDWPKWLKDRAGLKPAKQPQSDAAGSKIP